MNVGSFHMDQIGTVTGPADYMNDPNGYDVIRQEIESGRSVVFNAAHPGNPLMAALVAIQTHYAGWKGNRQCIAWMERELSGNTAERKSQ